MVTGKAYDKEYDYSADQKCHIKNKVQQYHFSYRSMVSGSGNRILSESSQTRNAGDQMPYERFAGHTGPYSERC